MMNLIVNKTVREDAEKLKLRPQLMYVFAS